MDAKSDVSETVRWAPSAKEPAARPSSWVIACAAAEGIGMTASALAAQASQGLAIYAALAIVVVGGLIEGTALGVLQAAWLARRFPGLSRFGWIVVTILIAGVGWALASAPSALGEPGGAQPDAVLVLLLAAGLGLAMGAFLGAGQALVLRHHVRHPWRWIWVSAAAWTPAMLVIFTGATIPDASWQTAPVVVLGALTGVVAGGFLGVVSLALMGTLEGSSVRRPGRSGEAG